MMDIPEMRTRVKRAKAMGANYTGVPLEPHDELTELLDALEKAIGFGGHKADCAHWAWKPRFVRGVMTKKGRVLAGKKCNCGWEAFLAKHKEGH